ncbi:MAG: hypothetical protein ACI4V1_01045 [Eubacteriales bacterium]
MRFVLYLAALLPSCLSSFFSDFSFHPMSFVENLRYMGLGMLCIFIVIGVIIGATALLERIAAHRKSGDE